MNKVIKRLDEAYGNKTVINMSVTVPAGDLAHAVFDLTEEWHKLDEKNKKLRKQIRQLKKK